MQHYAGQDLAKRRDYSTFVIIRVEEPEDGEPISRVVGVKQWPHVDYKQIIEDTALLYLKYRWRMLGIDRSTVGDAVMEEYEAKGIPVDGVLFTAQSKHDMVQFMLMLLQQKRLRLPRKGVEELKAQIVEQERIFSPSGIVKYEHPEKRHDDQFWALCLALHVAKETLVDREPNPIVYSSANSLNARWPELSRPGIRILSEASTRDVQGW